MLATTTINQHRRHAKHAQPNPQIKPHPPQQCLPSATRTPPAILPFLPKKTTNANPPPRSVNRRTHRERAQPLERQRLGLLEKHKDYQKRATDYKAKQKTLKSLREKAAERNDDEFYFGMMSRSGPGSALTRKNTFTGAVEGDRGNRAMDVDVVRLLKTQDLGYLRTVRNVARREREGLEERWVLAGGQELGEEDEEGEGQGKGKVRKIVFCEGEGEREGVVEEKEEEGEGDEEEEKKAKNLERLRVKLLNARKRVKALAEAEYQLELQQAKMAKTATSGGYTKGGHKIKVRERKR